MAGGAFAVTFFFTGQIKAGIVFAILFIIAGAINIEDDTLDIMTELTIYIIWFVASALVTCFLSELVLNEDITSLGVFRIFLGCIICLFLFLLLYSISLRPVASVSIIMSFLVFGTAVNYYVYRFRGSEVQPADILSIATAGDIAGEYKVVLTSTIIYAFILTGIYIFLSLGLPKISISRKLRCRIVTVGTDIILLILFLLLSSNISFYNYLNIGSKTNGYILNFMLQLKETFVKKPNPYSIETISDLSDKYTAVDSSITRDYPDIIVIMDESFADLSYLGDDINTNIEVTPFIDSLSENTHKGYVLTSVFGGNTANSEFEFLTGHSLLFLPIGSVAYQQYIDSGDYSVVNELNSLGYTTIAMHPNKGMSWSRDVVYDKLGFDESYFLESFPGQDFRRSFISDQEMFVTLIESYEEHKKSSDNPVFYFGVTIQNHGSYEYNGDNYIKTISLEGYSQDYTDVEQYLSMIHETDSAVKYLLDYFSKSENDVVVLLYGDHYPSLNEHFYEEVHGGSFNTLSEQQLKYTVPFFIWTNYKSEEDNIPLTSLNYLANHVYTVARIPLPTYNKALEDFRRVIPALNSNGYYSVEQGCFMSLDEAEDENEKNTLNLYNQLEYNAMFDIKNRDYKLFPLYE